MRILETERDSIESIRAALVAETAEPDLKLEQTVRDIIADVRTRGDESLLELGRKFDSPDIKCLQATEEEFDEAYKQIKPELLEAFRKAKSNIQAFHEKQLQKSWMEMHDDFVYGQIVRPLDTVGVYAPAGLAPLPSTVFMTAIPAVVAGVRRIIMCSPARQNGGIEPSMLVAARECGITEVFKIGGAQAAAAMAYGTNTVPKVDKIAGPGNVFYNEGKRQVFGIVGIDQIAGPSEILVLADDTANPVYVAADMLSQAEHAPDSKCVLITTNRSLAGLVIEEIKKQSVNAPRKDYIRKSLDDFGIIIIARDTDEAISLANIFAPEHLEIALKEPWEALKKIKNAGTVMVGHYTPVPLCDFAAGPNHTLPTAGTARFGSALGVDDFIKKSGLLSYTKKALEEIAPTVIEMAQAEGLDAHANTIKLRISGNKD